MRPLVTAFPLDIRDEPTGHTSLIALTDSWAWHGPNPNFTSFWFYVELALDVSELGREVLLSVECLLPDGQRVTLAAHRATVPSELSVDDVPPAWGLRFQVPITVTGAGPHLIQLKADGELVTERTLHFYAADG